MVADDVLADGLELGYVRLWRKIKGSAILRDPHLLQLWVWILVKAAWGPRTVSIMTGRGRTLVHLQPGQFVFGRKSAGDELGQPAETLRGRMGRLKSHRMITIQPTTHYSVVTVVNWASYQGEAGRDTTQPTGQHTSQPPGNHHKEEVKEVKERSNTGSSAGAPGIPALYPQEKNNLSVSDGSNGRGNGKAPQGQAKTKGRSSRSPKSEYPQAVRDVYQAYSENIVTIPSKKADALRNIAARLLEGYTPGQLIGTVERYYLEAQDIPEDRRFHPNNFFGQKAYFLGYLPEAEPTASEAAHA